MDGAWTVPRRYGDACYGTCMDACYGDAGHHTCMPWKAVLAWGYSAFTLWKPYADRAPGMRTWPRPSRRCQLEEARGRGSTPNNEPSRRILVAGSLKMNENTATGA